MTAADEGMLQHGAPSQDTSGGTGAKTTRVGKNSARVTPVDTPPVRPVRPCQVHPIAFSAPAKSQRRAAGSGALRGNDFSRITF